MNANYVILIFSALFASLGQLFFKLGVPEIKSWSIIFSYKLWLGLFLYFLGTVLWIYALSKLPLNRVYPFSALTFIFVFLLSYFVLGESISLSRVLGLFVIFIGFVILYYAN